MHVRRTTAATIAALLLAACGGGAEDAAAPEASTQASAQESAPAVSEPAAATPSAPADTSSAAASTTVEVASTDLGDVLVDGEGMTLYVFDNDTGPTSSCTGDCATNWPPVTGPADAGDGVDAALLGTTTRDDGTEQVTYDDQPLYYFAGDAAAGDLNGQGVGDVWWVVGPDGQRITG